MPEFVNPFSGTVPRQMTHGELVRAIMLNISAEYEAVHLYMAHMDATDNQDAKKVLYDVALEELVHAGEFTNLLYRLDPVAADKAREGFAEVDELLSTHAPVEAVGEDAQSSGDGESAVPTPQGLTVGNLIGTERSG